MMGMTMGIRMIMGDSYYNEDDNGNDDGDEDDNGDDDGDYNRDDHSSRWK